VIILRTTFLFEFEGLEQDQGLKYSSAVVQPDMPSDRSIYWSTDREYFSSFTYSYEWHPSFDNRHLAFRDFVTESSTPDSLIVFQIIRQGGGHSVIPVNGIQLHDTGISDWHITSHHVKPQLLFVMKQAVWLWTFGRCLASESSRAPIEYIGREGTLTRIYELIGVQFPPTGHPNDFSKVSSITFSYCGKYATICIQGANHARVVPLPQDPLENGIEIEASTSNTVETRRRKRNHTADSDDIEMSTSLHIAKIPRILDTTRLSLRADGQRIFRAVHVASASCPNTINLTTFSSRPDSKRLEEQKSISLVKTPGSIDLRSADAAVLWPEEKEKSAQVILMEKKRISYDSDEPTFQRNLPLILERDRRYLAIDALGSKDTGAGSRNLEF
jgi:hypothetical protein